YSSVRTIRLHHIRQLILERDLILLLMADILWSRLRHTNRRYWREQLTGWAEELARMGPPLSLPPPDTTIVQTPRDYPVLCLPPSKMIEALPVGDMPMDDSVPERSDPRMLDEDFLATLLRLRPEASSQTEEMGDDKKCPERLEDFL